MTEITKQAAENSRLLQLYAQMRRYYVKIQYFVNITLAYSFLMGYNFMVKNDNTF